MLMKTLPSRKRRILGTVMISTLMATCLLATAQYGYAAQKSEDKKPIKIITINQSNDELKLSDADKKPEIVFIKDIEGFDGKEIKDLEIMLGDETHNIELFNHIGDENKMIFVIKDGIDCEKINAELKKSNDNLQSAKAEDDKKSGKIKDKHISIKSKRIIAFKGDNKDNEKRVEGITFENPSVIVCNNGEFTFQNGSEAERLREAIKHLKAEEENVVERIRKARIKLEDRLKEIEKKK